MKGGGGISRITENIWEGLQRIFESLVYKTRVIEGLIV